jgi:5-methylcytosine-specific restriction endonuclease McrA
LQCQYCGIRMFGKGALTASQEVSSRGKTTDHIVPRFMLAQAGINCVTHPSWYNLNCARVCVRCNARKGSLWPLDWLEIMPEYGVKWFCNRLADLGCPTAEIDAALDRRYGETAWVESSISV